jgi:hypothetical protein
MSTDTEKTMICPACGKAVAPSHFACVSTVKAGRAGGRATGDSKRRGDSDYYRNLRKGSTPPTE